MPYLARRSYRSGGRWPYRSWRRGTRSAAVAGNRRFNVCIPVQDAFTMTVGAGQYYTAVGGVCPYYSAKNSSSASAISTKASMVSSILYRTYSQLYDEVKINAVSVDISFMTVIGAGGVVPAAKFFTSWDRNCTFSECVQRNGIPNNVQIQTGSESQVALLTNTSSMIIKRFVRATDLIEKARFHDCTVSEDANGYYDEMWGHGDGHNDVGFCPAMFFCLNTAASPASGNVFSFSVSLEVKWYVTFRNPKFGLSTGDGRGVSSLIPSGDVKSVSGGEMEEEKKEEKYEEEVVPDDDDIEDSQVPITDMSHDELVELVSQLRKSKAQ